MTPVSTGSARWDTWERQGHTPGWGGQGHTPRRDKDRPFGQEGIRTDLQAWGRDTFPGRGDKDRPPGATRADPQRGTRTDPGQGDKDRALGQEG